jgi:opacity protein-like surface antigen
MAIANVTPESPTRCIHAALVGFDWLTPGEVPGTFPADRLLTVDHIEWGFSGMKNLKKAVLALGLLLVSSRVRAEDTRHKWQLGGGISYFSTIDDIRSNSTTAYAPVDPTQGGGLAPILFSDPRPDANELNQPTIQDGWKLDFNASFGFTRWFALEIGASYFQGPVGNIEFYTEDRSLPVNLTPTLQNPPDGSANCLVVTCLAMSGSTDSSVNIKNGFLPVGQLTEVPVQLSGIVRFRPESPFDPYVGGGIGYIFTGLDTSQSDIGTPVTLSASTIAGDNRRVTMRNFDDVQAYTNGLIVKSIGSGARNIQTFPLTQEDLTQIEQAGGTPITGLTATVNSAPEFHLMGGVDYYFTNHFSLYIDGRYTWAQSNVEVRIDKQTQILSGIQDYGCVNGAPTCTTLNGSVIDTSDKVITNPTFDDVQDVLLIQGGDIRLGGFSLGIGVKYTF